MNMDYQELTLAIQEEIDIAHYELDRLNHLKGQVLDRILALNTELEIVTIKLK